MVNYEYRETYFSYENYTFYRFQLLNTVRKVGWWILFSWSLTEINFLGDLYYCKPQCNF
jgi:hypothetical protein